MAKCSSTAILPCIARFLLLGLKQIALPRTAAAVPLARPGGFAARFRSGRRAIGAGADAAVGELDFDRHAGSDRSGHTQWLASRIADERKTARQHPAIGKRGE